jgi:hypothetical protein
MSTRVISPLSYKNTSDDKVDVALLKCRRTLIGARGLIRVGERCQLFGSDHEPPSVATRISNEHSSLFAIATQGQLLKKAQQFEYDHDNNNYSDNIEDASVHSVTVIRLGFRWPAFIQNAVLFTDSCARDSAFMAENTQSGCRMIV